MWRAPDPAGILLPTLEESDMTELATEKDRIVAEVRQRYGQIAKGGGGCCLPSSPCGAPEASASLGVGYRKDEIASLPEGADLGLGCGAPVGPLALRDGETVLDLGSGAGIDAFLAARQVGPRGRVIGVDMTPEMLERARANARKAGLSQVEFREGRLESLPVADASVDAVTSNCVINLVPDKRRVFAEIARVLKPGGRLVISDVVLDGKLPEAVEKDVYAYTGCVAGAALREGYFAQLAEAGLGAVEVLKDVDYVAALRDAVPEEAEALLRRTGVSWESVAGKVRSITFRARKAV
jgi:SAM-dependent methyltransferase